jgi:hypothetical protein
VCQDQEEVNVVLLMQRKILEVHGGLSDPFSCRLESPPLLQSTVNNICLGSVKDTQDSASWRLNLFREHCTEDFPLIGIRR